MRTNISIFLNCTLALTACTAKDPKTTLFSASSNVDPTHSPLDVQLVSESAQLPGKIAFIEQRG